MNKHICKNKYKKWLMIYTVLTLIMQVEISYKTSIIHHLFFKTDASK